MISNDNQTPEVQAMIAADPEFFAAHDMNCPCEKCSEYD